jgi:hypothetical protein
MGGIEASAFAQAMRQWLWLYPSVEIVHLVGIATLVGSIVVLDLRLLGISRSLSVRRLAKHVLPWTLASFALIVPSGFAMFAAHASELISNPAFLLKLSLIGLAGVNAALFHTGAYRSVDRWDVDIAPPLAARVAGAASLLIWISVIACGRLLAYT